MSSVKKLEEIKEQITVVDDQLEQSLEATALLNNDLEQAQRSCKQQSFILEKKAKDLARRREDFEIKKLAFEKESRSSKKLKAKLIDTDFQAKEVERLEQDLANRREDFEVKKLEFEKECRLSENLKAKLIDTDLQIKEVQRLERELETKRELIRMGQDSVDLEEADLGEKQNYIESLKLKLADLKENLEKIVNQKIRAEKASSDINGDIEKRERELVDLEKDSQLEFLKLSKAKQELAEQGLKIKSLKEERNLEEIKKESLLLSLKN